MEPTPESIVMLKLLKQIGQHWEVTLTKNKDLKSHKHGGIIKIMNPFFPLDLCAHLWDSLGSNQVLVSFPLIELEGNDIERLNPFLGESSFRKNGWCYSQKFGESWFVEKVQLKYNTLRGELVLEFYCDRTNKEGVSFRSQIEPGKLQSATQKRARK